MKVKVNIDEQMSEPEICISGSSEDVERIRNAVSSRINQRLEVFSDGKEYFMPADSFIFFEAIEGKTWAHTADKIYEIREKLYSLEEVLPANFIRISKSVIVNTAEIVSIAKNLAGPSVVRFRETEKRTTCSRKYYKLLAKRLNENLF